MDHSATSFKTSRLDLRLVECEPKHPGLPKWRSITILIDGQDFLGEPRNPSQSVRYNPDGQGRAAVGWDPEFILGPESPLLPTSVPRRVAVYTCSCGIVGCGNRAPIISEDNGLVHWTDIRSITAFFTGPDTYGLGADPNDVDEILGPPVPVSDFTFDSVQYRSEIARASREFADSH